VGVRVALWWEGRARKRIESSVLGVTHTLVDTGTDFVTDCGFQVHVDGTRNVFSGGHFTKEGVEGVIGDTQGLV
jgi:hypothetical protein